MRAVTPYGRAESAGLLSRPTISCRIERQVGAAILAALIGCTLELFVLHSNVGAFLAAAQGPLRAGDSLSSPAGTHDRRHLLRGSEYSDAPISRISLKGLQIFNHHWVDQRDSA
jgi:hypothetical protein